MCRQRLRGQQFKNSIIIIIIINSFNLTTVFPKLLVWMTLAEVKVPYGHICYYYKKIVIWNRWFGSIHQVYDFKHKPTENYYPTLQPPLCFHSFEWLSLSFPFFFMSHKCLVLASFHQLSSAMLAAFIKKRNNTVKCLSALLCTLLLPMHT